MSRMIYDRQSAVDYAHKWAFSRNPQYHNFENSGGDCTNFASQVLFAGSGVMNYMKLNGWFYRDLDNRTASWSGVLYLHRFLVNNSGRGPYGHDTSPDHMQPGDIIQLSNGNDVYHHSLVVVRTGLHPSVENIQVATHSMDSDNRPLTSYDYSVARFIHIEGVRN